MTAAVGVMGAVGVDAGVLHHVLHRLDHGFARGLGVVAEIKRHGVLAADFGLFRHVKQHDVVAAFFEHALASVDLDVGHLRHGHDAIFHDHAVQFNALGNTGHFGLDHVHGRAGVDDARECARHVFAGQHFLNGAVFQLGVRGVCGLRLHSQQGGGHSDGVFDFHWMLLSVVS